MTVRGFALSATLAFFCLAAPAGWGTGTASDPGRPRAFTAATLAKVTPGRTTKAQVEALLGKPWRTTFSDDADEPGPLVWEYRGRETDGTYRVHIEFDSHGIATLIAKISDSTAEAPARTAKTPSATKAEPER